MVRAGRCNLKHDEISTVTLTVEQFRKVQNIDDRREAGYGVYYAQELPLNAAALKWRQAVFEALDIGLSEPRLDNHTAWSRIWSPATFITK